MVPEVQPTHEERAAPLVRPIGSLTDPSPQALVPCCRQLPFDELCPDTGAILAGLTASKTHGLAVVPSAYARLTGLERIANRCAPRRVKPLLLVCADSAL